jgi:hypothetical protein
VSLSPWAQLWGPLYDAFVSYPTQNKVGIR